MTVSEPVSKSYIAAARYDIGTNRECSRCDYTGNSIYPGADEICADYIHNDCNGAIDYEPCIPQ